LAVTGGERAHDFIEERQQLSAGRIIVVIIRSEHVHRCIKGAIMQLQEYTCIVHVVCNAHGGRHLLGAALIFHVLRVVQE